MDFPAHKFLIAPINFKDTRDFLKKNDINKVDMILADLGVSSMQLDDPSRGFSYKIDAPLDLRMNPLVGEPASEYLARLNQNQLAQILTDFADETHAQQIAKALIKKKPKTTFQMTEAIRSAVSNFSSHIRKQEGDLPFRRAFQALRIAVNEEFSSLEYFLKDIPTLLKPGGRVAILSFHSGEDRRVKKSFQHFERLKIYSDVSSDFIRPTFEEQHANPRSKSAKLRWAIRGQN
jgi:16S rRNA (cytosine1402-N4)-methyltransferase